jgi:hypothetical protein
MEQSSCWDCSSCSANQSIMFIKQNRMAHKKWPWPLSLAYSKPHLYTYFNICLSNLRSVCFHVRFNDRSFVYIYIFFLFWHATCAIYHIHLDVITLIIYGEDYKLWSFPSCLFHHSSITSYLIVCSAMCPETSSGCVLSSYERRGKIVVYNGK